MSAKHRNFIFFFPDEMRAESLACYGNEVVQTPNLDRLASEGTRFEQCHVQHTVCTPSRCSLMTGWYPHTSGHRTLWHLLRPHEPSLFRYLKQAGYRIEWFGKNDLYSEPYAKEILGDTDRPAASNADGKTKPQPSVSRNAFKQGDAAYYSFLYEPQDGGEEGTETAIKIKKGIEFLQSPEAKEQPFFLYVPSSMPHPPYSAPLPFHDMYDPERISELRPANLGNKPIFYDKIREYRKLDQLPESLLKKIHAVYLGMISHADYWLGQLLDALAKSGLEDSTTIIVASDHGDWAGDYGLVEKWPSGLDDTLTRVPLIVRTPGGSKGHVSAEPVELFDIMATVLDIAGVKAEHSHFARSLTPQLAGLSGDPDRAVFTEGGYDTREPHCFEGRPDRRYEGVIGRDPSHIYYPKGKLQQDLPQSVCRSVAIRTSEFKLVRRTFDTNELYDLRTDPRELNNVYGNKEYEVAQSRLESRLLDWYVHTSDVVPVDEDPRGLPKANDRSAK